MSRITIPLLLALSGCWGANAYIVEGTVVEVNEPRTVVIDHKAIEGLGMGAMVMDFQVADPGMLADVRPGDKVTARMLLEDNGAVLEKLRVTGHGAPPPKPDAPPVPVKAGDLFPPFELALADGGTLRIGEGQDHPVALTFLYTTCPLPEYCPAIVMRLQALQPQLPPKARIVAVTIDPEHDTPEVLRAFAETSGAGEHWKFATMARPELDQLALRAGLHVVRDGGGIQHSVRLLVLGRGGKLIARYDDNDWPMQQVKAQLR